MVQLPLSSLWQTCDRNSLETRFILVQSFRAFSPCGGGGGPHCDGSAQALRSGAGGCSHHSGTGSRGVGAEGG